MVSVRSRSDEEKELRQQHILEAAIAEFDANGYEKTSMGAIAKRAGLSRTLVNFYFGDKQGVHAAIEMHALIQLTKMFKAAADKKTLGIEKLVAIGRAYIRFHKGYPGYFEALARADDNVANPELNQPSRSATDVIDAAINTGLKDGSVSHNFEDTTMASLALWATAHGFVVIATNKAPILKAHWGRSAASVLKSLDTLILSAYASD